jgi:omega-6 fatty acid desaturase (delta-12 desaturase)
MPFYHAQEATLAVRKVLGDYYLCDHTPVPVALWKAYSSCRFVQDKGDILFMQGAAAFNEELKQKAAAGTKKTR